MSAGSIARAAARRSLLRLYPEVNVRVAGLEVDALWRVERVVVELDGHASHAVAAAAERDRRRDLTMRGMGFIVLRYTWQQVTRGPELVVADLRRELAAARTAAADVRGPDAG